MAFKTIKKILIANRGEIACRIIRTCREKGIETVAVYSEADAGSLFVRQADQAFCIGSAPSNESYLCIDKIIRVAKDSGADAIHPGYGFLSEKAPFSKACADVGLIFLGPTPEAIEAMGDKVTARGYAKKAKVPMVPGTMNPVENADEIKKLAKEFGYPVLLKASAGGGGKGMRVVESENEISSAAEQAKGEALKSFGDDRVYLEKFVRNPRHVEIQIARDTHGNGLFLMERECSMQRRHQKVIEEAPCCYLKEEVRQKMAACSLQLADAIDYHGVGTVEFLVDEEQNFYFLEMNTRLQVEHCVTEMITGLDLVALQILIGEGRELPIKQNEIQARGHSIEARIYAEDPEQNFMPSPGVLQFLNVPEGPGIRHDTGVVLGSEITIYYDPMVAKLIIHAATRDEAIQKLRAALQDYHVGGLKNNVYFLKTLLETDVFQQAKMHTQFIDQNPDLTKRADDKKNDFWAVAAMAVLDAVEEKSHLLVEESSWWHQGLPR